METTAGGLTTGWWAAAWECFSSHPLSVPCAAETGLEAAARRAFKKHDANGTGSLDHSELREALADMKIDMSSYETAATLRSVDADGNGRLELAEFTRLCKVTFLIYQSIWLYVSFVPSVYPSIHRSIYIYMSIYILELAEFTRLCKVTFLIYQSIWLYISICFTRDRHVEL